MRRIVFPVGALLLIAMALQPWWSVSAEVPAPGPAALPLVLAAPPGPQPKVGTSTRGDTSPELRSIPPSTPSDLPETVEVPRLRPGRFGPLAIEPSPDIPTRDPVLQDRPGVPSMPSPIQSFAGVSATGYNPPDTNGDVGPNHYVQMVNVSFAIYDKSGTLLYGPALNKTLWAGYTGDGGICAAQNSGDPIVLYDPLADRWLMSQFALPGSSVGYYQCIAISQTPDPLGAWHRYGFRVSGTLMNDYPKFGVWPDAYYMTANQFYLGSSYRGVGVWAFDRAKMLAGDPSASYVYFDLSSVNPNYWGMLPADFDGSRPPAAGSPGYFVELEFPTYGWPTHRLSLWRFHVDWTNPANSNFGVAGLPNAVLNTASFDPDFDCGASPYRDCLPQPGTSDTQKLDAISDLLMYRLQYRNFGDHESLVVNHTVDADGTNHAGIRWYEIRDPGGTPTIYQQGTYAPDANNRWMGSAAMDHDGNIAIGYSVASGTIFPSIRYAGRLASDPLGTLPQGEVTLIAGGGSQLTTNSRWGDYSSMSVDPVDDCTFWYTQEYYASSSYVGWSTRIGSFKFPTCGPAASFTASPISGTVPLTVSFTNQTSSYTSLLWGFGDGATSSETNPVHTYMSSGVYTVTLIAADTTGTDTLTRTNYVTAYLPPQAAFSASPISGNRPLTVTFVNQSTGDYTSLLWNFGDGTTSAIANPTHTYTATGVYSVSLNVSSPISSDTITRTNYITVTEPFVASFAASPTMGTAPLTVTFTNQSTGDYTSLLWSFGDGATSTITNPVHTYTSSGAYTVTLTITGTSSNNTFTRTNYIAVYEPVSASFSANPTSGIRPLNVAFTNQSSGPYTASLWSFGDGTTDTSTNPGHTYNSAGTYTVSLMVSNPGGSNTITRTSYITVYEPVVAAFTASPTAGNTPLAVSFTDQSTGDYSEFRWNFGDGSTSTLPNPTHIYTSAGTYTVDLTVKGPGGTSNLTRPGLIAATTIYKQYFPLMARYGVAP